MLIEPVIKGVVARTAHPEGCKKAVQNQIDFAKSKNSIVGGAKKVLILGASSGFGLASRIALTFGGSAADTIGVSFERGPSDKGVGTAGWYNNIYFREAAEKEGRIAKNFVGDAFSPAVRQQVVDYIRDEFGGQVDLVVYSLATGVRPNPETGEMWRSCLKTVGEPFAGQTVNIEKDCLEESVLEPASQADIEATEKVMGGEDWQEWIQFLLDQDVMAKGAKTVAYSYIGPEVTYPIYHHGTLGIAKKHLHATSDVLNEQLASIGGTAHVSVCKALVTKASVFIPAFSPYILCLFKVMKQHGLHEGCIEQMQRMFSEHLYGAEQTVVDSNRLIRVDDWELRADIQAEVAKLMEQVTSENFTEIGDYQGYKQEFLELNGFALNGVDYQQGTDVEALKALQP
ncbi:enoyl-[acyl-carrier-protein] reductase FabV [Photobacterium sanctipauli]|uniref:Enoyl-[acyl-carrier-protein] reductase [NADH] n=1 Tax=Photobacterium sanctipauli TaxID=1342794 RepID=A0A2T3NYA3_9GAMM|nr:enoyl-ACP reductase FabV [Photobacterium sanctipauli]PSW21230.1 enoyl-[acyl-carrier-protein] reductase FabV [Photobacterium sanctipauli]